VTLDQRLAQLFELVSATCNQDEVYPALGELDGELLADSPAGARDQRGVAAEVHEVLLCVGDGTIVVADTAAV
jgi:hypothetical protein